MYFYSVLSASASSNFNESLQKAWQKMGWIRIVYRFIDDSLCGFG
jgi:hypothetical protein